MKREQTILHPANIKEDTEINYEQKAIILNGTKIISLNEETIRHLACKPHQRLTESWTVRGLTAITHPKSWICKTVYKRNRQKDRKDI